MKYTNTAAVTIELQAAHYQLGVTGTRALLRALDGKLVTYRTTDDAPDLTGYLTVGLVTTGDYMRRNDAGEVVTEQRTGFTFLVQLGPDFVAGGLWADAEGQLDLVSLGRGATITL